MYLSDLRLVFIVPAHWNTTPRVRVMSQPGPLSWLRTGGQLVSNTYVLSAKQSSRTSNFNVFGFTRPGIEPSTSGCQANAQPLHYPADVMIHRILIIIAIPGCFFIVQVKWLVKLVWAVHRQWNRRYIPDWIGIQDQWPTAEWFISANVPTRGIQVVPPDTWIFHFLYSTEPGIV